MYRSRQPGSRPHGAGYPEISDDDCRADQGDVLGWRYDVTEGCYKILRTWKLIDWCVYSPDLHSRYPDVIVDDRLVASEQMLHPPEPEG